MDCRFGLDPLADGRARIGGGCHRRDGAVEIGSEPQRTPSPGAEGGASLAGGLLLAVLVAVISGFGHRAGGRRAGPLLVMQIHVGASVVALPLALWHVGSRRVRPRATDFERRTILRGALLAGASTGVTLAVPHAGRAPTRSLEREFVPAFGHARHPMARRQGPDRQ